MDDVVGFTEKTAEKLYALVRANSTESPKRRTLDFDDRQPMVCIVNSTGGCTASTSTTPGTGEGIVQIINDGGTYENFKLADGTSTLTITFYNTTTNAIAAGRYQLKREAFGSKWLVDVAECS